MVIVTYVVTGVNSESPFCGVRAVVKGCRSTLDSCL